MESQTERLEKIIKEIVNIKLEIIEEKISNDEDESAIDIWSEDLETKLAGYKTNIDEISAKITATKENIEEEKRQKNLQEEESRLKRIYDEEKHREQMRSEIRQAQRKGDETTTTTTKAKLPKLVITKFKGTYLDWTRFWAQIQTEIDKSNIPQVTKFSYLKELLATNVRVLVDGLPFSAEGYERAKNILASTYGKPSEVVNAHVQEIMNLQTVYGSNPVKIYQFYEKLLRHVEALETMGKLNNINGYVRATIDRLPGIRSDLVRLDDNWQEWGFQELVMALR